MQLAAMHRNLMRTRIRAGRVFHATRSSFETEFANAPQPVQNEPLDRYINRPGKRVVRFRWRASLDSRSKSTIVLGAGWTCHPGMYTPVIPALNRKHALLTIENAGHWNSPLGNSTPTTYLNDLALDANAVLDLERVERVVLVGHSMWGFAARKFALEHPDKTAGIVFMCAPFANPLETWIFGNGRTMDTVLRSISYAIQIGGPAVDVIKRLLADNPILRELVRASLEEMSGKRLNGNFDKFFYNVMRTNSKTFSIAFRAMLLEKIDELTQLGKLSIPILVITGESDLIVSSSAWSDVVRKLPNARLIELPVGHLPTMEAPEETIRLIDEFVRSCKF